MRLHRDHRVTDRFEALGVEMIDQLIQRFSADAARVAVLEEQQRPLMGFGEKLVQLVDMLQGSQVWMHSQTV